MKSRENNPIDYLEKAMTKARDQEEALQSRESNPGRFAGYKGGKEMPLTRYATLMNAALAAALLAAKQTGRDLPDRASFGDLRFSSAWI